MPPLSDEPSRGVILLVAAPARNSFVRSWPRAVCINKHSAIIARNKRDMDRSAVWIRKNSGVRAVEWSLLILVISRLLQHFLQQVDIEQPVELAADLFQSTDPDESEALIQ